MLIMIAMGVNVMLLFEKTKPKHKFTLVLIIKTTVCKQKYTVLSLSEKIISSIILVFFNLVHSNFYGTRVCLNTLHALSIKNDLV